MIIWEEEEFKGLCDVLKKELNAVPLDRHPMATLDELLRQARIREGRTVGRIRQREADRIVEWVNVELKKRYGKYVGINRYKIKDNTLYFSPNIEGVFRTPGGYIYKTMMESFKRVFFTSHSITRFEERVQPTLIEFLRKKLSLGMTATALDMLSFVFFDAVENGVEYAYEIGPDKCLYINARIGILVFNRFKDIFVAKTFLTPDMIDNNLKWFSTDFDKVTNKDSFDKMIDNHYPIDEPCYYSNLLNLPLHQ
jgi:hypothetical protein